MNLTPEQKQVGRENFQTSLGFTRRDFLATAAVGLPLGAFYFGYKRIEGNPVRAGIIGCGDEGQVLVAESNPDYIDFIGFSDIRPSNQKRAMEGEPRGPRIGFRRKYGKDKANEIAARSIDKKYHDDYHNMLFDPDIDMIVIALPLHLHAKVSIEAMEAGKHVLCEKLMAQTVKDCKDMIRASRRTQKLLAIGHQRHYSVLYDNAVSVVQSGMLGDIRHIRALWHRNNSFYMYEKNADGTIKLDDKGQPIHVLDGDGRPMFIDGWRKLIPAEDQSIDFDRHGYKDANELVRWRLFNNTGGGLMAELGSHQLDACSIFIARGVHGGRGHVHPLAVSGVGVKSFYEDEREADDHIFCTFEFPGPKYAGPKPADPKAREDVVIVTYSSINTNAFEAYGETIYGSRGTMIVDRETEIFQFKEGDPNAANLKPPAATNITIKDAGGKPVMEASPTAPAATPQAAIALSGQLSKGYREEMEHFAYQVKNFSPGDYDELTKQLRCNGTVAMGDAVIALVANMAMKQRGRIAFKDAWFDPTSDENPEDAVGRAEAT
jgi:predicted dehydrogenase